MCSPKLLFAGVGLVLVAIATPRGAEGQPADDGSGLWTLGVAASSDDQSNRSVAISLDAAVAAKTWLSAFVGDSRSPRARADVTASTLAVGIDHRLGLLGFRFGAERWGDAGSIESSDYDASLYVQTERVKAELGFEQRNIDITASITGPEGRVFSRKVPFTADGRSLGVRVNATDRLTLRFRLDDYDYPPGLALLPRIDALNLLSASTLTLANSFVSEIRGAGIDLELGTRMLSFDLSHDESAIDGSTLSSFDAALLLPIGRRFDLELSLGRSRSDLFESGLYGGLAFLIYGGG